MTEKREYHGWIQNYLENLVVKNAVDIERRRVSLRFV